MNIYEEMQNVKPLTSIGTALAQFVESLSEGRFELDGRLWVYRPHNFVAIQVQWKRSTKIVLSLWGYRSQFEKEKLPELPLYRGRYVSWRRCEITSPRQLAAAARYIKKSFEFYKGSRFGKNAR